MATLGAPSPTSRLLLGLLCIASGIIPVLAVFNLGPLDRSAINGPPWLGLLAGSVFIAAGIALMLGERLRNSTLSYGLFAGIIGAFACIASWIAFGPGARECAVALAGMLFESGAWTNDIVCRGGFGVGAALLDGFVIWMIASALRGIIGPGLLSTVIEKIGIAILLIALAPIILPLLLFLIGKILLESVATGGGPDTGRATMPSSSA
ncbi:MAG TPA: hypothetical protein VFE34_11430 [Dongiaceae bacterium]|jgi:hypothetical protein|nr:hypothetical protein [Dongiaceae bacterium]